MTDSTPTPKRGLSRTSLICGGLLWTIVFASLGFVWLNRDQQSEAAGSVLAGSEIQGQTGEPVNSASSVKLNFPARELPNFEFDECMGGTVGLEDLKGKPWVASFIFTSCPTTCPMITTSMMKLQNQVIDKNPDVMLVTITVNPKYDKVDVMKTYSETFRPDRDRWKFLTGDQQEIYELVVNGFGLYVKENVGEMRTPGFEVAHSNRVVLVNEEGTPVGTFLGTKDDDMVKLRRILTGKDDFPEAGPALSISSTGGTRAIKFDVKPVEDADANVDSEGQTESAEQSDEADTPPAETDSTGEDDDAAAGKKKKLTPAEHNALIDEKLPSWAKSLPTVNASLNTVAGLLLMFGYIAIRNEQKIRHRNLMITAFVMSVAFLTSYLLYHYQLGKYTGEHGKQFMGSDGWKTVYLSILVPHVLLAAIVPLMAIRVFQHAFAERWDAHKRLAKITFPIWMFVSVTGVVIYGMLYHWPA